MTHREAGQAKIPRILVVDDTPDNLFLMNGLLEDQFTVVQAASGREALEVVMSGNPPDIVLLDIMMPDMDGYEVLRRMRQHPPTAHIPVIFLTALASAQDEHLGMNLGAVDYLTKPVDPELVLRRVDGHVRHTAHSRRIDALAEKLARHLTPEAWQRIFHGPEIEAVRFEQRPQTVLHVEVAQARALPDASRDALAAEVEWLAARHLGTVDRFVDGATLVFFEEAEACVRMALDLQRGASHLPLSMGVCTAVLDIATFRSESLECRTIIGDDTRLAVRLAASTPAGSVAVAPATWDAVKGALKQELAQCVVTEDRGEVPHLRLTLVPARADSRAGASLHQAAPH